MADKKSMQFVVISHSHWDREWYLPFQAYRIRLVALIDRVLDILAREPAYKHFMADGQTVLLEDYLAIRPDRRRLIARLVREGRLLIGPWYVAPDEFLSGGESLIRNLQRGLRMSRRLGAVMSVGYSPDAFGHIAHLPAILRGFGIESAVVWRGLDEHVTKTEFTWQSPDGSSVLALHLPLGYAAAWPLPTDPSELKEHLLRLQRELAPRATTRYLALMNGNDHAPPQPGLPALLETANSVISEGTVVQGNLPDLMAAIRAEIEAKDIVLPLHEGEMRSGRRAHLLPGALSARMWVKQRSQQCERLLVDWLEPLAAWSTLLRRRLRHPDGPYGRWREPPLPWGPVTGYPTDRASISSLVSEAWRLLLLNHSHDSIYGCGADPVYVDVAARFDACEQIAGDLVRRLMAEVAAQVDAGGDTRIVVFNPTSGPRTDFVAFDRPAGDGRTPSAVVDAAGRRHPCQIVSTDSSPKLPFAPPRSVQIGFVARNLPGHGYRAFHAVFGPPVATPDAGGPHSIENELFEVIVDPKHGAITVRDKKSGRVLSGLNRLVDGGDRGDAYNHEPPPEDALMDRPSRPPTIRVVERGPARSTLQIDMTYAVPAALTAGRRRRSRRRVALPVRCLVHLYPGVRRVDFRTEVDNRARDHRLRAHFPTGIQSDVVHAEQHFGVVARPIAIPESDETWMEQPAGTQPQKSFVDVNDGTRGLLLANRGLPEYEALPDSEGVALALTLLRCVGWLSRPDLSVRKGPAGPTLEIPGAQCIGRHVLEYAIVPHDGGWEKAIDEAYRFARPLQADVAPGSGVLSPRGSLIDVAPASLVVSSVKLAEDSRGLIVRLYNVAGRTVRGRVRLNEPHGRVDLVNLNEERLAAATLDDGWVRLTAKRNEIVTLKFAEA